MSTAKVIEVISEGSSIEDAVEDAVKQASESLHSLKSVWVENIKARVDGDHVTGYRINAKLTFVLDKKHHSNSRRDSTGEESPNAPHLHLNLPPLTPLRRQSWSRWRIPPPYIVNPHMDHHLIVAIPITQAA